MWRQIKTLRLEYLTKSTDLKCDPENNFIPQEGISANFKALSTWIGVESSDKIERNFSSSEINLAAEMFMFLNSCPSFYLRLYWKAIYGPKTRIALLASNIIKKANDDFKSKAIQIFSKITQVLGFKHISHHYEGKESFGQNISMKEINLNINVRDKKLLQSVSNHPVHIINNEGKFSPSAFIPFCSFGEEFIGAKVSEFDLPVCNIFKPRVYFNQLCYETDLQELKSSNNKILTEQLEKGLTLILDFNEERQFYYNVNSNDAKKSHHHNDVSMYLDTISIKFSKVLMRLDS